jgi:heme exporter protein D
MDQKNLEKMNNIKNIMVKHSHKLDLILGVLLIAYSIYGYVNDVKYFWVAGACGLLSLAMAILKPVKKMDTYMNAKIISKQKSKDL